MNAKQNNLFNYNPLPIALLHSAPGIRGSEYIKMINRETEWRTSIDFPKYEVNRIGEVRNKKTKRLLKLRVPRLYKIANVRDENNISRSAYVHRMVAKAFVENPNNYPMVNHIDGNKLNNRYDNLEWCTCSMNIKHSYDTGLRQPIDHPLKKPVLQIDKSGNVVNSFKSCSEAYRKTGIRHIREARLGKQKTAGGYYWRNG